MHVIIYDIRDAIRNTRQTTSPILTVTRTIFVPRDVQLKLDQYTFFEVYTSDLYLET